jgi:hypothetical protein
MRVHVRVACANQAHGMPDGIVCSARRQNLLQVICDVCVCGWVGGGVVTPFAHPAPFEIMERRGAVS